MPDACPVPLTPLLEVGSTLADKYRIERLLAEGGMGIVYEGFHVELEQRVAVKVVRAEYAHHQEAVERFLNEARAIARLRGHHIAKVLDTGRTDTGAPYMVLEYLEGRDLRTVLDSDGPLPIPLAVNYLLQTCEALAEAHAVGLIHRDLKPDNLFISRGADGEDVLKVIDFGISKRIDRNGRCLTKQGQSLGSPHYMAPEQMASPEQVDTRADIWSLGIVLYELLTNAVPFSGESLAAACLQVLTAEPISIRDLRSDVPDALERIILRCLAKQREGRYGSVQELAVELSAFAPETLPRVVPWLRGPVAFESAGDAPTLISRTDAALTVTRREASKSAVRPTFNRPSRRNKVYGAAAALAALGLLAGFASFKALRAPSAESKLEALAPERPARVVATERTTARAVAAARPAPSAPEVRVEPVPAPVETPPEASAATSPPVSRPPVAGARPTYRAATTAPAKSTQARSAPASPSRAATPALSPNDASELVNPYPDLTGSKRLSRSDFINR